LSDRSYPGQPRFATIKTIVKVHARTEYADRCSFDTRHYIPRRRSTLNASPAGDALIGASKACTGYSTSSSKMTCPATAPATEPKTWPSCGASLRANKSRGSIKTRRKRAGWNPDSLLQILQIK
jgi:hypothetical protein